ncbi:tRNA dihydrouridine(20/20a) synthase DusA [Rickettsiella grylli]|uniref:tRNA dihydrouridine(20/20a) synthase DusA n=1 Tax=Rickettsiella grylli TaxID=59196 RepID=UPI0008FCF333|nr:tRNA dihydrouridine(20/20a) synthase DusA [Rickettsiella grylli]
MLKPQKKHAHSLMVAPMLGWTTRHYHYFFRLICKKAQLYTEMFTAQAILKSPTRERLLTVDANEKALAIQLGGGIASDLSKAAKIVESYGYSEINLNVGCPSEKVQSGGFGVLLLKEPNRVADAIAAMKAVVRLPVTVKTRIGVDNDESYDYLVSFIRQVSLAGCDTFIIHARKAWLHGVSPKENREIPPLNYQWVYQIKRDFPHLTIVLNGGITCLKRAYQQLQHVDAVMIGRAAWYNPYLFAQLDALISPQDRFIVPHRFSIILQYLPYLEKALKSGENLAHLIQPLLGLFHGVVGTKQWRQTLSELLQRRYSFVKIKETLQEFISRR